MQRIHKINAFALLIACALVFALFVVTPVRAEADVPTSDPAPVEVSVPPADIQPADPVVEPQAPTEAADEAPAELATETQPADGVAELPAALVENDVQLVTAEEEALPLASEAVVEAVKAADPYFFVGTTRYSFTKTDCDPGTPGDQDCSNPIQAALDYIRVHGVVPSNRMIYVEDDIYDGEVSLNGSTSSSLSQIQGLIGIVNVDSGDLPALNGNLSVLGTTAGFTLSNFTVNGKIIFDGNKGALNITNVIQQDATGTGLTVINHYGSVTLTRVTAQGNRHSGAEIDTTAGGGSVTISESVFDHNGGEVSDTDTWMGLYVNTTGAVALNGISASSNNGSGAVLWGFKSLSIRNSLFNENRREPELTSSGYGLDARTSQVASISLETLTANGNAYDGLQLITSGSLTAKNLTANENGWNGLIVCGLSYQIGDCTQPHVLNVSLSNIVTNNNGARGEIISARGTVTIRNAIANGNTYEGIFIYSIGNVILDGVGADGNDIGLFISTAYLEGSKGSVTLLNKTGNNHFDNNNYGLEIRSTGAISLSGVSAQNNKRYGAFLDNTKGKAAVNVQFGSFSNNDWYGIEIHSNGGVTFQGSANNNGNDMYYAPDDTNGGGLYIYNQTASGASPVSITGSWFNENRSGNGLYVESKGNITLVDVGASGNGRTGASLRNFNAGTGSVLVKVSTAGDGREMSGNWEYGLEIYSNNTITVQNMSFYYNQYNGAELNNYNSAKKAAVTVKDVNFNYNVGTGLIIRSKGAVTVTNIQAVQNQEGIYINNWDGLGAVKILRTAKDGYNNFSDNNFRALGIVSNGAVTLERVIANNSANENYIDNCKAQEGADHQLYCTLAGGSVTITAPAGMMSEFSNNGEIGLRVVTSGAITLVNIRANNNRMGMVLQNDFGGLSSPVAVKTIGSNWNEASNNNGSGLTINSHGVVSVTNIEASRNNGYGVLIVNQNSKSAKTVSLNNGLFNDNRNGDGLSINTSGTVTLSNVSANNNDITDGILNVPKYHDNQGVIERIVYYDNAGSMIDYWRFTAPYSGEAQFNLFSEDFIPQLKLYVLDTERDVWIEVASVSDEDGDGLASLFYSPVYGNEYRVAVSSLSADQTGVYFLGIGDDSFRSDNANGANGLAIISAKGSATVNNPANSGSFNNNSSLGIYISAVNVSLSNIHADQNIGMGASLRVRENVRINGWANSFNENHGYGLFVSGGAISLANLDAIGNDTYGICLRGDGDIQVIATRSNWVNRIDHNGYIGLDIFSNGNVLISNASASNNGSLGANISYNSNSDDLKPVQDVKILKSDFSGNAGDGLYIDFNGSVTLDQVSANNNQSADDEHGNGIYIDNTLNNLAQNVTVMRSSFSNNHWNGLQIESNGRVFLDGLTGMGNGRDGVYVNNQKTAGVGVVILTSKTGANSFLSNGQNGVTILSNKAITVSGVETRHNDAAGIRLVSSGGAMLLLNVIVHDNYGEGIYVETHGFDALFKSVQSYMNGLGNNGDGLQAVMVGANLRLTNSSFYGNGRNGVNATLDSLARLVLTDTICFANGRDGSAPNYSVYY